MTPPPRVDHDADPMRVEAAARTIPLLQFRRRTRRVHDVARHNFNVYFLIPVMLIVVSAMVALIGGTLWLTTLQNRAEGIKERDRVKASFMTRIASVQATTKVFAVWDDAARRLVATLDPAWADTNIGAYVHDHNGIEATFVVDRSGRTLYAFVDGRRSRDDAAVVLGSGYAAAIQRIMAAPRAVDAPISGTTNTPRGTAIFSIVRIRPHGDTVRVPAAVHRYTVMAKFIDRGMLGELTRDHGMPLHFSQYPRFQFSNWSFAAFDGQGARSLSWLPVEPGTRLLRRALPWLSLLIGLMTILAALVLTRARKAARELIASETKALYLANRDALTGLPNRRAFSEHLVDLGRRGARHCVMFLDLDGFKRVNDTFGHGVGDKVLCRTGERLQRVLPASAFLARLGGDEFAVTLATSDAGGADLDRLAARLIEAVNEPHHFGGEPTTVGLSIGIVASDGGAFEEIVRHADSAMYAAKQRGRNGWQHYRPSLDAGRDERRQLECDLKQALADRQIFVVFQPIIDARTQQISGVEALARWTHPTKGPISPDIFVSIAEESGLIVELGKQILEQACLAARNWPFRLSVNLSPAQFWHRNLVDEVIETLDRYDFPASRLEFEITETYLLRRPEAAEAVIKTLRRRGVRIALDDFGTGYASIGYLRRFQFDLVKIDRSLVEAVVSDSAAADVFVAIVSLCQALGLPILAEGVETREQAELLTENGCAYLQGWHFGRPMLAAQIDVLVSPRKVA